VIHPNAAGIDVGATEHVVAVPCDRDERPVRTFQAFAPELRELAAKPLRHSHRCTPNQRVFTGSVFAKFWSSAAFEIRVVNARHVKDVPGRTKADVLDCQFKSCTASGY
jgi:transposase